MSKPQPRDHSLVGTRGNLRLVKASGQGRA